MELITQAELARRLGVKPQYIQNLIKRKVPPIAWSKKKKGQSKLLKWEETRDLIEASNKIDQVNRPNRKTSKKYKSSGEEPPPQETIEEEAPVGEFVKKAMEGKASKDHYGGLIKQQEYELLTGTLVRKTEVQAQALAASEAIKGQLLSLAPRLAPRLASVTDEFKIYKIIEDEVRVILALAVESLAGE